MADTKTLGKIRDILIEYGCDPDDYDEAKVAAEIADIIEHPASVLRCTFCGHTGQDVARYNIGGHGLVPCCVDNDACLMRRDAQQRKQVDDSRAMREASAIRG